MTPHTFTAGGMVFTCTFTDRIVARLKTARFDLRKLLRKTRRLPRPEAATMLASLLFDDVERFGEVLHAIVRDQIPASWDGDQFARAIISSGASAPQVVCAALIDWLATNYRGQ